MNRSRIIEQINSNDRAREILQEAYVGAILNDVDMDFLMSVAYNALMNDLNEYEPGELVDEISRVHPELLEEETDVD